MLAKIEHIIKTRAKRLENFETIRCEDCGGTEELTMNRYSDAIKCTDCLNRLLREEEQEELNCEEIEAVKGDERRQMEKDAKLE